MKLRRWLLFVVIFWFRRFGVLENVKLHISVNICDIDLKLGWHIGINSATNNTYSNISGILRNFRKLPKWSDYWYCRNFRTIFTDLRKLPLGRKYLRGSRHLEKYKAAKKGLKMLLVRHFESEFMHITFLESHWEYEGRQVTDFGNSVSSTSGWRAKIVQFQKYLARDPINTWPFDLSVSNDLHLPYHLIPRSRSRGSRVKVTLVKPRKLSTFWTFSPQSRPIRGHGSRSQRSNTLKVIKVKGQCHKGQSSRRSKVRGITLQLISWAKHEEWMSLDQ